MSDKTKGLWGSLKELVVEDVPEAAKPVTPTTTSAPPAQPAPSRISVAPPPEIDSAARRRLEDAINASAPPGYVEVMDTVATLADSIPDENARYRAALKLAAKRGHSVDDVLGDIDKCIGILEAQGQTFENETKSQMDRKIGARQKSIENLDGLIQARQTEIARLQGEMSNLSIQRTTEASAIAADTANIESVRAAFGSAFAAVHSQLQERRQKIATYGKTVPT